MTDDNAPRPIGDLAQLRSYLATHGLAITEVARGLRAADPPIEIQWAAEHRQVRFRTQLALDVPADRRPAVAALVARANAAAGRPMWRTDPELHAEIVAPTAVDGSISSREVDEAIATLRASLSRDAEHLRAALS